jgi:hypothetical protein
MLTTVIIRFMRSLLDFVSQRMPQNAKLLRDNIDRWVALSNWNEVGEMKVFHRVGQLKIVVALVWSPKITNALRTPAEQLILFSQYA